MQSFNKDLLTNTSLNKTYSSGRRFDYNYQNIFTNNSNGGNVKSEINSIHNNINNLNYKIENFTYKIENIQNKIEDFNCRIQNAERKIQKCNVDMQKICNDLEERLNNRINQKFYQLNVYAESNYKEFINKYNILTNEIQRIDSDLAIISFKLTLDSELSQFKLNKKITDRRESKKLINKNDKKDIIQVQGSALSKMKIQENI